jgi:DNA-binding response OmpR family regulator
VARVLVIDDEPGIRNVLRSSLEASGFEVVLADDVSAGSGSRGVNDRTRSCSIW